MLLGFDPSLTSSGYAYRYSDGYHTGRILSDKLRGQERLFFIEKEVEKLFLLASDHVTRNALMVMEGYAMGARGRSLFDIGELGGVLKMVAWKAKVDILLVPPTNLKQFLTGHGGGGKEKIPLAIEKTWGYSITSNDEADAFGLLKMGEAYLHPRGPRASSKAKALQGCKLLKGCQN